MIPKINQQQSTKWDFLYLYLLFYYNFNQTFSHYTEFSVQAEKRTMNWENYQNAFRSVLI